MNDKQIELIQDISERLAKTINDYQITNYENGHNRKDIDVSLIVALIRILGGALGGVFKDESLDEVIAEIPEQLLDYAKGFQGFKENKNV